MDTAGLMWLLRISPSAVLISKLFNQLVIQTSFRINERDR